jgi:integrase-like protein
MTAARKSSRWGHRDATMILIGYRHGLRAVELCDLQWSQVELNAGRLHVRRAKNGSPSVHPIQGDEIRALRRLQREQEASPFVFCSERGGPMTPKAWHALFGRIGERAKLAFPVHPHMLRHGCGYALANHAGAPSVAWPQEHSAHGALHRACAGSLQEFLALGRRPQTLQRAYCGPSCGRHSLMRAFARRPLAEFPRPFLCVIGLSEIS